MANGNKAIKQAMRNNEKELLAYARRQRLFSTATLGSAWHGALDRLLDAGMMKYSSEEGRYMACKGGRPVTPAVR